MIHTRVINRQFAHRSF